MIIFADDFTVFLSGSVVVESFSARTEVTVMLFIIAKLIRVEIFISGPIGVALSGDIGGDLLLITIN